MRNNGISRNLLLGMAAGIGGTIALQLIRSMTSKAIPQADPPIRDDPGRFMVKQAERILPQRARRAIPQTAEKVASQSLGIGYGAMFGALYGAAGIVSGSKALDGALLGLLTWATGYLGWLPATGLMPPIWRHSKKQVAAPLAQHLLYGLATVGTFEAIDRALTDYLPGANRSVGAAAR